MHFLKGVLPFCLALVVGLSGVWVIARFGQLSDAEGVNSGEVAPINLDKEATTLEPVYMQSWLEETCVAQEYEGPYGIGRAEFDETGNMCVGQVKLRGNVSPTGELSNVEVVKAAACGLTERALHLAQKSVDEARKQGVMPIVSDGHAVPACVEIIYQFNAALKRDEFPDLN